MLTLEELQGLTGLEEDELIACLYYMDVIDESWYALDEEYSMSVPISHEETETLYFNSVVPKIAELLEDFDMVHLIINAEERDVI